MTDLRKAAEEAAKVLANALSIDFNDKRDWYSYKHDVEYAANILCQALAQPEQEPVAWLVSDAQGRYATIRDPAPYGEEVYEPLYAAPPKREWVGLTDDEKLGAIWTDGSFSSGVKWAEAKLKEKNGAT